MKQSVMPRWYVVYWLVLLVLVVIAGCVTSRRSLYTYINPTHPQTFTNVAVAVPAPPGMADPAIQVRMAVRQAVAQVVLPPGVRTNTNSWVEYIPPNGGNDTKRRWTFLMSTHDFKKWSVVTSNEQVSGYYVTNNVKSTNAFTFLETVSDDGH